MIVNVNSAGIALREYQPQKMSLAQQLAAQGKQLNAAAFFDAIVNALDLPVNTSQLLTMAPQQAQMGGPGANSGPGDQMAGEPPQGGPNGQAQPIGVAGPGPATGGGLPA